MARSNAKATAQEDKIMNDERDPLNDTEDDREEERGQSPYQPTYDGKGNSNGNWRKPILIALAIGAAALAYGMWLGA